MSALEKLSMQKQEVKVNLDREQLLTSSLTELESAQELCVLLCHNLGNSDLGTRLGLLMCLNSAKTLLMELLTSEQKTCQCGSD